MSCEYGSYFAVDPVIAVRLRVPAKRLSDIQRNPANGVVADSATARDRAQCVVIAYESGLVVAGA